MCQLPSLSSCCSAGRITSRGEEEWGRSVREPGHGRMRGMLPKQALDAP